MERKIVISAESTIDLPKSMLEEFNIHTVPFTVMLGDKARLDGEFDTKEIFDFVFETKNLPKTSAVNEYQYQKHFAKLLKEYDYVIHFTLSSEMSSAYSNACKVSDKLNGRVFVVDSRSLSTGIALLAIYAAKLSKECSDPESYAMSYPENCKRCNNRYYSAGKCRLCNGIVSQDGTQCITE